MARRASSGRRRNRWTFSAADGQRGGALRDAVGVRPVLAEPVAAPAAHGLDADRTGVGDLAAYRLHPCPDLPEGGGRLAHGWSPPSAICQARLTVTVRPSL